MEEEDEEATVVFLLDDEDSSAATARDLQQASVIDQGREMPDKAEMSHMMKGIGNRRGDQIIEYGVSFPYLFSCP